MENSKSYCLSNYCALDYIFDNTNLMSEYNNLLTYKDKYIFYRVNAQSKGLDCDASFKIEKMLSHMLDEIGETDIKLRNDSQYKYELQLRTNSDELFFRGDTFVNAFQIIKKIILFSSNKEILYKINQVNDKKSIAKQLNIFMNPIRKNEFELFKNTKILELLEKHIKLCYQIGNFWLLPSTTKGLNCNMNQAKGSLSCNKFKDNYYIALDVIKHWYLKDNKYNDNQFYNHVELNKNYFNFYGKGINGWKNFVDSNCFYGNFVDKKYDINNYLILDESDIVSSIKEYLENCNFALEKRKLLYNDRYKI